MKEKEIKDFLDKLDRIYEAAMKEHEYSTALAALTAKFDFKIQIR